MEDFVFRDQEGLGKSRHTYKDIETRQTTIMRGTPVKEEKANLVWKDERRATHKKMQKMCINKKHC